MIIGQRDNKFLLEVEDEMVQVLEQKEGKNFLYPPYRRSVILAPSQWNEPSTEKTIEELLAEFPVVNK